MSQPHYQYHSATTPKRHICDFCSRGFVIANGSHMFVTAINSHKAHTSFIFNWDKGHPYILAEKEVKDLKTNKSERKKSLLKLFLTRDDTESVGSSRKTNRRYKHPPPLQKRKEEGGSLSSKLFSQLLQL